MPAIDRDLFLADLPARTGVRVTDARRDAFEFLLARLSEDAGFTMLRELAYVLATVQWETAGTFLPIRERRFNRAKNPRAWENQDRYWRTGFFGRGYVQITWDFNYAKAGARLAGTTFTIDGAPFVVTPTSFTDSPDLVMDREVAYAICSRGMRDGWFTGRKLGAYIRDGEPPDYFNARRVINGTDHAADIAALANAYELLLRAAAL